VLVHPGSLARAGTRTDSAENNDVVRIQSTRALPLVGRDAHRSASSRTENSLRFPANRQALLVASGAAGGTYETRLNVLPGDVNRSGSVLADDFSEVKARFFKTTNSPAAGPNPYDPLHDVDGSGSILADDFSAVKKHFFDTLPPAAATALPTAQTITSQLFGATPVLG